MDWLLNKNRFLQIFIIIMLLSPCVFSSVRFLNLNDSATVVSSVAVGEVIYVISTSEHVPIEMITQTSMFSLERNNVRTNNCLPAGYTDKLAFVTNVGAGIDGDFGTLNITVKPTFPIYNMPPFQDVFLDPLEYTTQVLDIEYDDTGHCVEFTCSVHCLNSPQYFWIEGDTEIITETYSLELYTMAYELLVTCVDDTARHNAGVRNDILIVMTFVGYTSQSITMTTTPSSMSASITTDPLSTSTAARFVNLNASISISSGTEKGNTIYTLSTSQDVGRIAMEPLSSNYALNGTNGDVVTTNCLFPAQTEQLSFYLFDIYGTAGARGFLYITTEPAIPVYDMPKDIDVIVDPLLDIVDVFGIKYDYPGQCAQFVCRAMCLNFRNKQFWIFDNTVRTTVGDIYFFKFYELSVVCTDRGTDIISPGNFFSIRTVFYPSPDKITTTMAQVSSTTTVPHRSSTEAFTNLDANLTIYSNTETGRMIFVVEPIFSYISVIMSTYSRHFEFRTGNELVVRVCLKAGHTETLQFYTSSNKRSSVYKPGSLDITVLPTMPQISFPISNMIYTVNVEQVLDVTNVTTVEFSNEEDCVAFQCSVTSDSNKIFWYTGKTVETFTQDVQPKLQYNITLICSDNSTDVLPDKYTAREHFSVVFEYLTTTLMTSTTNQTLTSLTSPLFTPTTATTPAAAQTSTSETDSTSSLFGLMSTAKPFASSETKTAKRTTDPLATITDLVSSETPLVSASTSTDERYTTSTSSVEYSTKALSTTSSKTMNVSETVSSTQLAYHPTSTPMDYLVSNIYQSKQTVVTEKTSFAKVKTLSPIVSWTVPSSVTPLTTESKASPMYTMSTEWQRYTLTTPTLISFQGTSPSTPYHITQGTFPKEQPNGFLLSVIGGGIAGITILVAVVTLISKHACKGVVRSRKETEENDAERNYSPYSLSSDGNRSTSGLLPETDSTITQVDI